MDNSKNRLNDHLGVNKIAKNIRKSPLHQPNFANNAARQQPQPQVYNISKNDFRNIVQQLTGSPSRNDPLPRPPQNPPKPQSMRLQRIKPPPLTPINRPHIPPPVPAPAPAPAHAPAPVSPPAPYNTGFVRPGQYGQASPTMLQPMVPGDALWPNTAESPISAYMRYLQTSLIDPSPVGNQGHPQLHPPVPGQPNAPPSSGLLPNPQMLAIPSPRGVNGPPLMPNLPSPRMNGSVPSMPNLPSPRMNWPGLLPSPISQFLLPSPTGYMNLLSARSNPYGLLSPGFQFPPLSPNFAFSPMGGQSGILGPGPQAPPSPGLMFPLSPSGFFAYPSPRWRDQ